MDLQEIEITISKNGEVELHVRGVKGEACLDVTRDLEAALGNKVISRELTPEAIESSSSAAAIRPQEKNRARK